MGWSVTTAIASAGPRSAAGWAPVCGSRSTWTLRTEDV